MAHDTHVKLKVCQKRHTYGVSFTCVKFIVCQKWHTKRVSINFVKGKLLKTKNRAQCVSGQITVFHIEYITTS